MNSFFNEPWENKIDPTRKTLAQIDEWIQEGAKVHVETLGAEILTARIQERGVDYIKLDYFDDGEGLYIPTDKIITIYKM